MMTLPLRTLRRATPGALRPPAAMGQAGPALIVAMTTPVTPCGDVPTRRCSIRGNPQITPPPEAAMLAAPTRSRWPLNPQDAQRKTLPLGLGTLLRHPRQVEEVP